MTSGQVNKSESWIKLIKISLDLCSYKLHIMCCSLLLPTGASAEEEDELYERGVVESNCVYRLVEDRLVPHEQAWASIPSISLLGSTEV